MRTGLIAEALLALWVTTASALEATKPNILVIFGDDIGILNVSAYGRGVMGYQTPNIDRIAREGADLHRLLRPAELHRRARRVHHRPERRSAPASARSACPARRKGCRRKTRPSPSS